MPATCQGASGHLHDLASDLLLLYGAWDHHEVATKVLTSDALLSWVF